MSTQNHYETLGVDESSSFEEIQGARDRLLKECAENKKQTDAVEAAYDAILMNRLKLRQEGKLKVPDRIRFPEQELTATPQTSSGSSTQSLTWVSRWIDTPSRKEVLWAAVLFLGVALIGIVTQPSATDAIGQSSVAGVLAFGGLATLYLLNRKEKKFVRSLLFTLATLSIGVLVGTLIGQSMESQLQDMGLTPSSFTGIVASFFFWLVSSFFK